MALATGMTEVVIAARRRSARTPGSAVRTYWTYLTSENRPYTRRSPSRNDRSRQHGECRGPARGFNQQAQARALNAEVHDTKPWW